MRTVALAMGKDGGGGFVCEWVLVVERWVAATYSPCSLSKHANLVRNLDSSSHTVTRLSLSSWTLKSLTVPGLISSGNLRQIAPAAAMMTSPPISTLIVS